MNKTVVLGGRKIKLEANALTLLLYEDRFKGRRLLQDVGEVAKIKDIENVPFSLCTKFLWITAKTADENIADIYEWAKSFSISEVMTASHVALKLICEDFETSKKVKATGVQKLIHRLMTFLHMR